MKKLSSSLLEGIRGIIASFVMLGAISIVLAILKWNNTIDIGWELVTLPIWGSMFTVISMYLVYGIVKTLKK